MGALPVFLLTGKSTPFGENVVLFPVQVPIDGPSNTVAKNSRAPVRRGARCGLGMGFKCQLQTIE